MLGVLWLYHPHDISVEDGEQSQLGGVVKQSMGQVIFRIGYPDVGAACANFQIDGAFDLRSKRSQSLGGESTFSDEFTL